MARETGANTYSPAFDLLHPQRVQKKMAAHTHIYFSLFTQRDSRPCTSSKGTVRFSLSMWLYGAQIDYKGNHNIS